MPPGVYPTDPFEVIMLRTPGVPEILSAWLKQFRDNATLSPKAQELSILFSGRKWNSQAIWWGHQKEARQAGASSAVMDSIEQGKRLPGMAPDELALYNYLDELYTKHAVSDATFKKAVEQFGEPGVLNIIGICGFYDYLSMFINTSKIYIPEQFKAMAPKYPQATAH
jgi:4-carboxymuconolactone decarboxylase